MESCHLCGTLMVGNHQCSIGTAMQIDGAELVGLSLLNEIPIENDDNLEMMGEARGAMISTGQTVEDNKSYNGRLDQGFALLAD